MLVPHELRSKDVLLYMRFCVFFFFHSPLFPSFFLYFFTVPHMLRPGAQRNFALQLPTLPLCE